MSIYAYSATDLTTINKRWAVGEKITSTQLRAIIRACTVLSNARWTIKTAFASGWDFRAGTINWFLPLAGGGRFIPQVVISGANVSTWPTIYWRTMSGGYTIGSVTGTSAAGTNFTWPTSVSAPNSTRIYAPFSPQSYRSNREAAQYGCGRLVAGSITAVTPLSVSVWSYPYASWTYYAYDVPMCQPGRYLANVDDNVTQVGMCADILRACDAMLDQAETNPVILYALPFWTIGTGGTNPYSSFNATGLGSMRQTAQQRWIPLVNLGRRRAVWIAGYSTNWSTSTSINLYVEVNDWRLSANGAPFAVYRSGNYALFAVPIPADAYRGGYAADGIPLARVLVEPIGSGCSAWVGDAP